MSKYGRGECKWKFETRADAKRARRRLYGKRNQLKDGPLSIYRCEVCGFYHLGHLPTLVRNGQWDRDDYRNGVRNVSD